MIYDCFTFFNELDLLELRLKTLGDVVDRFVLVESTRTFTNQPKPLNFESNKKRFQDYLDRIIYVIVDDNPDGDDAWIREHHQRNSIINGLNGAADKDIILISDLDEIPNPADLRTLPNAQLPITFEHVNCYYHLNTMQGYWHGTRACTLKTLKSTSASHVRYADWSIQPSGWHFSFLGGKEAIINKVKSYSHQEYNTSYFLDAERIQAAIDCGADIFNRHTSKCRLVDLELLPAPVQHNLVHYTHFMLADLVTSPSFHEAPYHLDKHNALKAVLENVNRLIGRVISIGCRDGKTTSCLAIQIIPEILHAIDSWLIGIEDTKYPNCTEQTKLRNNYRDFLRNMLLLTAGNFQAHRMRPIDYLHSDRTPVKFCHLAASTDYDSLKTEIELLLPILVPGGILCGDDFETASVTSQGLYGGVERAVKELLPGYRNDGNFWWWRKAAPTPPLPGRLTRLWRRLSVAQLKSGFINQLKLLAPGLYHSLQDWWWRRQARKRMRTLAKQKLRQ